MTTVLDRLFDDVLDGIRNDTLKSDYTGCMCPKHTPWPRQPVGRDWRARYGNADWNFWTALHALGLDEITKVAADDPSHDNGTEGFTDRRGVWLRKNATHPIKTAAHELAHNVLGHVAGTPQVEKELARIEHEKNPLTAALGLAELYTFKSVKEIEAEMTALLVVAALGYPDGRDHTLADARRHFEDNGRVKFPDRDLVKDAARKILVAGGWREHAQAA